MRDAAKTIDVVVDTPRGSRCKYRYDPATGKFRLSKLLPLGAAFPFNFGFVPETLGDDGDPLDVLIIGAEPLIVGCVVPVRLIGILKGEQSESGGKPLRNDRLIGVVETKYNPPEFRSLRSVGRQRLAEIEHF